MAVAEATITELQPLEPTRPPLAARVWAATWPKLLALAFVLGLWQFLYAIEWRPPSVFPSPSEVAEAFVDDFPAIWDGTVVTLERAAKGFTIALVIGVVVGLAVSRSKILRSAIG